MTPTPELTGKIAIVTGAGKGIGLAVAQRLADAGATVVCCDIDSAAAESAAAQVGGTAAACDVTDEAAVQKMVADTVAAHGSLDILVSSAGVASVAPLVQMSYDEWRRVLSVDLDGVFLCTKHAAGAMAATGGGSIINIASIKSFGGSPATGHYGAAKAGVVSLSKTAALEMRDYGVRVNAVCPGWVDTDMVSSSKAALEALLPVSFEDYIGHVQGRLGGVDDITGVVLFLASDRSRFSSGSAFVVDGGATAHLV